MKKMNLVGKFGMAASLAVLSLAGASAQADMRLNNLPPTHVEEIHLHSLAQYAGKTLFVFYVSAREATLGVAGQTLNVKEVKGDPVKVQIDSKGNATVPAIDIPRSGFHVFNYVVFAVAKPGTNRLLLRNPDGTHPIEAGVTDDVYSAATEADFKYDRIGFVSARILKGKVQNNVTDVDSEKDF
jgi:hypothetical protein